MAEGAQIRRAKNNPMNLIAEPTTQWVKIINGKRNKGPTTWPK